MPSPLPRRWFRFSLRTLMVVVTLLCIWLAWTGYVSRLRESLRIRTREFDQACDEYRYADAYQFMSPEFRKQHTLDEYLKSPQGWPFDLDSVSVNPFTRRGSVSRGYRGEWHFMEVKWELIDGQWYATGETENVKGLR